VIVLLPSVEAVATREAQRDKKGYHAWSVEQLHDGFASHTPRLGLWIDTTDMTPDQTVDAILAERSP